MRVMVGAIVVLTLGSGAVQAKPGLSAEDDINGGLLAVGIADEIRKKCDSIDGRVFKALFYMNGLRKLARERGYSNAEINAYVDDKEEKRKMRRKGEAYMAAKGVDPEKPETFCDLGRAEIAAGTQIGKFLIEE
ncbi:DUF5333 domain-containing protein [uncultured Roseovarius sp.]|uniref:DUF5333 domain-containing protein n=1 Tax=uncultured Roseovarius sp. TaxID=293344 RepID=UPI0026352E42|nr:DUF5333 domain-containing protein [uncultured Roseovarius sp.]